MGRGVRLMRTPRFFTVFYRIVQRKAVVRPRNIDNPSIWTGTNELRARAPNETAVVRKDSRIANGSSLELAESS